MLTSTSHHTPTGGDSVPSSLEADHQILENSGTLRRSINGSISQASDASSNVLRKASKGGCLGHHLCPGTMRRSKLYTIWCSLVAISILFFGFIAYFVGGSMLAQGAMAQAVIVFNELSMTCAVSNQTVLVAAKVTISNVGPCGCSLAGAGESSGQLEVTVMYKEAAFGILRMPPMSIQAGLDNHQNVVAQPLRIINYTIWNEASSDLLRSGSITWRMKASAKVTVHIMVISPVFDNVPFDKEVQIQGFNSLDSDLKFRNLDVTGATNGLLDLTLEAEVKNPSNVALFLGPVTLELWTQGSEDVKLGTIRLSEFSLNANPQGTAVTLFPQVQASLISHSSTDAAAIAARRFLSKALKGQSQNVSIRGTAESTPMSQMKAAMARFQTYCTVPGVLNHHLLVKGLMRFPNLLKPHELPTQLIVQNPFSTQFTFLGAHCEVTPCRIVNTSHCDQYFIEPAGYYSSDPINDLIPSKAPQHALQLHPVKLYKMSPMEVIKEMFSSARGGSFIRLKGNMTMRVGDVQVTFDYEETSVPVCLYGLHSCMPPRVSKSVVTFV